jgi:hypothetical protein
MWWREQEAAAARDERIRMLVTELATAEEARRQQAETALAAEHEQVCTPSTV